MHFAKSDNVVRISSTLPFCRQSANPLLYSLFVILCTLMRKNYDLTFKFSCCSILINTVNLTYEFFHTFCILFILAFLANFVNDFNRDLVV